MQATNDYGKPVSAGITFTRYRLVGWK